MTSARFQRHQTFPQMKCFLTAGGMLWKMQVREWAFAQVTLKNVEPDLKVTSNNPNVVMGVFETGDKGIKATRIPGTKDMAVRFYAKAPGFTFIHAFRDDPLKPVGDLMQVEVQQRRAPSANQISLTRLEGPTVAVNAHDAPSYQMDKTIIFPHAAVNPLSVFSGIPAGTQHVVISSHGGVPTAADRADASKLCMFIGGFTLQSVRLDVDNAEAVFGTLKGKVANTCVIWFGGCNIGNNEAFCKKAAKASGCTVVAPVMPLLDKKFPKGQVDMLDAVAVPRVFTPEGSLDVPEFCSRQATHRFVVPI